MKALKLQAIGNSTGVILPKEVLSRLRVSRGDRLYLQETSDGIELGADRHKSRSLLDCG